ncbi:MAG: hypothetical protein N2689_05195, partial [Verrucomicrobiae bacterium]|nr:hypothetical protein [Verrucomicrobiae bacterium]
MFVRCQLRSVEAVIGTPALVVHHSRFLVLVYFHACILAERCVSWARLAVAENRHGGRLESNMNLRCFGWMTAALLVCGEVARADDVLNARVMLRPIGRPGQWMGLDLYDRASGRLITPVRFAANGAMFADRLMLERNEKDGLVIQTVRFQDLRGKLGSGLGLGDHDWAAVQLNGDDPFPRVDFSLTITSFTSNEWERAQGGPCPFHFLTVQLPEAEVWHQRGWLMATPKSDPFVLQKDVAFGGGSVAGEFSRNWSYVCALGGSPVPVIGLWAPSAKRYVGFEFQGTRMSDNTERDVCTAY